MLNERLLKSHKEISTPANPDSGFGLIYPKSDGLWYVKNSDGVERRLDTPDSAPQRQNSPTLNNWRAALSMCGATRSITNGSTASSTTIGAATAGFSPTDKGQPISGTNIPLGTVITAVASPTSATISQAAMGTGSGITFTIGTAAKLLVLGDSLVVLGGWSRFVTYMANKYNESSGLHPGYRAVSEGTFPWPTLAGTETTGKGLAGAVRSLTNGQTVTSDAFVCDRATFVWQAQSGGGTIDLKVDGVTVATVSATSRGVYHHSIGTPAAAHTFSFTSIGTSAVDGILPFNGNGLQGVQIVTVGRAGAKTTDWVSNADIGPTCALLGFHLVIPATGRNDVSLAAYKADMQSLITNIRTSLPNSDVGIWIPLNTLSWSIGSTAGKDLAALNSLAVFNAYDLLPSANVTGSYPTSDPYGLTIDGVHLSTKGINMNSDIMISVLGEDVGDRKQPTDIQVFSTPGATTWVKPYGAKTVRVWVLGAGGGGGSGRKGAASSVRCGGGGGASGASSYQEFLAADLPASVALTVGTGGPGGAAVSGNSTNGNNGTNGTVSRFGASNTDAYVLATSGGGGGGGTNAAGAAGSATLILGNFSVAIPGAAASTTGLIGNNAGSAVIPQGGAGGGSGGGITSGDAVSNGGSGGLPAANWLFTAPPGGTTPGGTGTPGTSKPSSPVFGTGGGGGASSKTGAAGAGGNGGLGSGGGGGGASLDSTGNSGKGGDGGNGIIVVITEF